MINQKYMNMRIAIGSVFLVALFSCNTRQQAPPLDVAAYKLEVDTWHQERIESLKANNGWLNLAGLFWLKEGVSTFGSDDRNDIIFPKDKIPGEAGVFHLQQGVVTMTSVPQVEILANDKPIKSGVVFHPDSTGQPKLSYGSLQWFIIKRDDQYGVRLRDLQSKVVEEFHSIDRYEVNPDYRVTAKLENPATPKKIAITNVLGQTTDQDSPGTLVFTLQDKEYRLDALVEGDELFVIFGDPTNERETYPSGRYLYANKPGADGITILDFNKAYNPPCAFTPFATCPLPPSQNILPVAISAGEKNYKGYSH
jgi:uncharacterized protein (DUF1684 family)